MPNGIFDCASGLLTLVRAISYFHAAYRGHSDPIYGLRNKKGWLFDELNSRVYVAHIC